MIRLCVCAGWSGPCWLHIPHYGNPMSRPISFNKQIDNEISFDFIYFTTEKKVRYITFKSYQNYIGILDLLSVEIL